jgi:hypothetical protein
MALAVVSAILLSDDFLLLYINNLSNLFHFLPSNAQIVSYNIMSKSVRSYGVSSGRGKESQESGHNIKEKIKEILYAIKEERQHI